MNTGKPAVASSPVGPVGEALTRPGRIKVPPPGGKARVLVVDDDERNLLAIETVLEDVADVVSARSGAEALRYLLREEFAVILLDVYMPDMDGYETAQIIRQREQSKRIPIIFLTAVNKEDSHMLHGYAMGAVDYVFKPFEPTILKSKVAVFVDLFEKTREIQRKAALEQQLLDENLRVNTEKLLAEQALRRAEERQAIVLQSLPIVLYVEPVEAERRSPQVVGGNLRAVTGFDEAEATAVWADRIHPDDRDRVLDYYRRLRITGSMAIEYRWQCADGQYKYFLDQAVALYEADGSLKEVVGTLLDVTERRQLEGQLIQAQKMDAIGKLTGGIAHDFNNLLAAVLGGLGLIERRGELNEEARKLLKMTRHAAEQGAELVRRLLAFSRKQQLQPAIVHLPKLSRAMNELMTHTLGGLVRCDWRVEDGVWPAFVDESQLELALMNLIINARDAMPTGGSIIVSGENRVIDNDDGFGLVPGEYVVITVTDTGHGMPSDVLVRAFEPFFTTKDVGKGTGLGLSMVYGFAQQSGGTARIESTVGQGTRIELWLPRAEDGVGTAKNAAADSTPTENQNHGMGPRGAIRILLVDDNAGVRETTAALLLDAGYVVTTANGGAEALMLIERDPHAFDMVVTDYAMPVVSGLEVIRLARNVRPSFPALIVTGYADTAALSDCPSDVPVLVKPFEPAALSRALQDVLTA